MTQLMVSGKAAWSPLPLAITESTATGVHHGGTAEPSRSDRSGRIADQPDLEARRSGVGSARRGPRVLRLGSRAARRLRDRLALRPFAPHARPLHQGTR